MSKENREVLTLLLDSIILLGGKSDLQGTLGEFIREERGADETIFHLKNINKDLLEQKKLLIDRFATH